MSLHIRRARPEDTENLVKLHNAVFDAGMTTAIWNWRYHQNPYDQELYSYVAELDGQIVSHYGAAPIKLMIKGQPVDSALYIDAMTAADASGHKLFRRLGLILEHELRQKEYYALLAFPNEVSHRLFTYDLGWQDVVELPMLKLNKTELRGHPKLSSAICLIKTVDSRFDELLQALAHRYPVWTSREQRYLQWRYIDNSKYDYTIHAYEENNRLLGYYVVKPFMNGYDIMDVVADSHEREVELLDHFLADAGRSNFDEVNAWFPVRHPLHHFLERRGFSNQAPVVYMMVKMINRVEWHGPDLCDPRSWYYTMGDSDVF